MKKAQTMPHSIEEMSGSSTIVRGKVIEAIVWDEKSCGSISGAGCACGGGGGCGGGGIDRRCRVKST